MKIVIPGGSGQVGVMIARQMHADGHEVVVLSRSPANSPWRTVQWDAKTVGDWIAEVDGADVVINLAGRSVNCRYTPQNRKEIVESRVNSTIAIGNAIKQAANPPHVWLQASTATIYAHRYDAPNDEAAGILGGDEIGAPDTWRFSINVAKSWEKALDEADTPHTRKVAMRAAMTMSADPGGVFDVLLGLVRHGLGGQSGDGRQYVSWIHEMDFVRIIYWLIAHAGVEGPINLAAPSPLPNREFMEAIRDAWGIKFGLSAANWMLELGAMVLQTETELILKSRRIVSRRLAEQGFIFQFPSWPEAAQDLCDSWREQQSAKEARE